MNVSSAFDHKAVQQQLRYEYQEIRKYELYARRCTDPTIKKSCKKMAQKHQQQYLQLLNQLN